MLAQRFSRLRGAPTRYAAMDPAHAQAIRNYLAIASRAQGLRGIHHSALAQDLPQLLGGYTEHAGNLLDELMRTNHHEPLGILNDLLQDHDVTPGMGGSGQLARLIQQMHAHTLGAAGAHPAVLRGYGDEAMRHPDMFRTLLLAHSQGTPPIGTALPDLLRVLTRHQNYDPLRNAYSASRDYLSPMHLVEMHDALDAVSSSGAGHLKQNAQNAVGGALRDVVHPALWHYGEHGEFPQ